MNLISPKTQFSSCLVENESHGDIFSLNFLNQGWPLSYRFNLTVKNHFRIHKWSMMLVQAALKSVVLAISDLHTFQSDTSRYHSADSVMPTPLHHNSFDLFLMCYSCYHLIWLRFVKLNAHCKTLPDRFVEEYTVLCKYWLLAVFLPLHIFMM